MRAKPFLVVPATLLGLIAVTTVTVTSAQSAPAPATVVVDQFTP